MIGDGQWVSTRDEKSVNYFLARIRMQDGLRHERMERRRVFWGDLWDRMFRRRAAAEERSRPGTGAEADSVHGSDPRRVR